MTDLSPQLAALKSGIEQLNADLDRLARNAERRERMLEAMERMIGNPAATRDATESL